MRIRTVVSVAMVLITAAAVGALVVWYHAGDDLSLPPLKACTVRADGQVSLEPDQMANAATIAAVGLRRGLPERAVVVALATALQESKLRNLAGGDRDSVGLFQQRPSQGWGTPEQVADPRYAADQFYSALLKVPGWQQMRVTDAAQAVQRSAYPEHYEKWAGEAAVLTRALAGTTGGAVACTVNGEPDRRGAAATQALTHGLRQDWGNVRTLAADGVVGLTVAARDTRVGWQYAHWLVAHAAATGVKRVSFGGREWTAAGGAWEPVDRTGPAGGERVVAEVYAER